MSKVVTLPNVSNVTRNIQAVVNLMTTRKPIRRGGLSVPIAPSHSSILEIVGRMKRSARRGHPQHPCQRGSSVPCVIRAMCMPMPGRGIWMRNISSEEIGDNITEIFI